MHYIDANETSGEKAWRQLRKNAASNIEATPHKAASAWPPTTHQKKLSILDELICDELIIDTLVWTPSRGRTKAGRPARTHI